MAKAGAAISARDFKFGLCCGMFLDASLPELIDIAARHGFPTITARPLAVAAALDAGLTERTLRRLLADAGIRVTMVDALSTGLPGAVSPDTFDPALRAVIPVDSLNPPDEETCLRSAEVLEAPYVNVSLFRAQRVPMAEMAEAVGSLCRRAARRGLKIALEFYPESSLPDLQYAADVVRTCGERNCAITLDTWHLTRSGGTLDDIRRLPPGLIAGIQISDYVPPPPGVPYVPMRGRSLPGRGELPLGDMIEAALRNSPDASAEIEVFNEELRALSGDAAAARISAAIAGWQESL
jgi:sugar phosphate isomerase/epimerase